MDFETAAKLSGSRFMVLKTGLARMERALGQFMLDLHTRSTATPRCSRRCWCKDDALFGTAQLPKFEEDLFRTRISKQFADRGECRLDRADVARRNLSGRD